ncbi:MAG: hypothetical protein MHMPM18_001662 [Marteilia pararefringens]
MSSGYYDRDADQDCKLHHVCDILDLVATVLACGLLIGLIAATLLLGQPEVYVDRCEPGYTWITELEQCSPCPSGKPYSYKSECFATCPYPTSTPLTSKDCQCTGELVALDRLGTCSCILAELYSGQCASRCPDGEGVVSGDSVKCECLGEGKTRNARGECVGVLDSNQGADEGDESKALSKTNLSLVIVGSLLLLIAIIVGIFMIKRRRRLRKLDWVSENKDETHYPDKKSDTAGEVGNYY